MDKKPQKIIEVARSFSRKVNLGNYETADFFCSAKEETTKQQAKKTSKRLHDFCRGEVEKAVEEYKEETALEKKEPITYESVSPYDAPKLEAKDKEADDISQRANTIEDIKKINENLGAVTEAERDVKEDN